MTTYVALLRGIGPGNPNMTSAKLTWFFESLGFKRVATVIGSGNVVFDAASDDGGVLEKKIERELPVRLGFSRIAIVRSKTDLEKLVRKDPFKGVKDERPNYLVVTFFKEKPRELCTVIDMKVPNTPEFMRDLEKKYGKEITTRTWKTVHRILKKMETR